MSDLIDRQAVLQIIDEWYDDKADIEDLIVRITYMPSVTPTERTGKWTHSNIPNSTFSMCTECGFNRGELYFNFCPNCGCRMESPDGR